MQRLRFRGLPSLPGEQRERHLLYRNDMAGKGSFVKLRLRASQGQYEAIGAIVTLSTSDASVSQVMTRGAGFVSCQAPELVFGLGEAEQAAVSVLWPGGAHEDFGTVARGARLRLVEGEGKARSFVTPARSLPDPLPEGLSLRVGERFPKLALVDAEGRAAAFDPVAVADGKPLLVNLWASTCVPCVSELPELSEIHADGERRVALLSVDLPGDRERAVSLVQKRAPDVRGWYLGKGAKGLDGVVDLLRLPIPTTLELDADGIVRGVIRGPISGR